MNKIEDEGTFYFVKDKFYTDFPNANLMLNKELFNGRANKRPCFFCFQDKDIEGIYWMVPISKQLDKYKKIYDKNVKRYGECNTIRFGQVLGNTASFLIQNMFPITDEYIEEEYRDKNEKLIRVNNQVKKDVIKNANIVLKKSQRGVKLLFTDINTIRAVLIEKHTKEKNLIADRELKKKKSVKKTKFR